MDHLTITANALHWSHSFLKSWWYHTFLLKRKNYVCRITVAASSLRGALWYAAGIKFFRIYLFKAYWLRDAPSDLTFNNCILCSHFIYVLYLSENKQRLVPLTSQTDWFL